MRRKSSPFYYPARRILCQKRPVAGDDDPVGDLFPLRDPDEVSQILVHEGSPIMYK